MNKIFLNLQIRTSNEIVGKVLTPVPVTRVEMDPTFADGSSALREFMMLSEKEQKQLITDSLIEEEAYDILALMRDSRELTREEYINQFGG